MNGLIIEDEPLAAERLERQIREIEPGFKTLAVLDTIEGAVNWFREHEDPELIFLDIQLADGISFRIFEQVNVKCPVIFTTAFDEYAMRAFELNSLDYLVKPIDKEKLRKALDKYHEVKKYFSQEELNEKMYKLLNTLDSPARQYKNRFLVEKGDTLIPITTEDIAYFYTEEKVVFLITRNDKRYIINYSLDHLEKQLDPGDFFRINRQFIISIKSIANIHNYFNYKLKLDLNPEPEIDVIVSRQKVKEFKNWLNQ